MPTGVTQVEHVIHVVGSLQGRAAQGLWPSVLALAQAGPRQSVLLLQPADEPLAHAMLPRDVTVVSAAATGWAARPRHAVRALLAELFATGPVLAVHLHGLDAIWQGMPALRPLRPAALVFLHPGAPFEALRSRIGRTCWALGLSLWTTSRRGLPVYVVHSQHVTPLRSLRQQRPVLLEQPVRSPYFEVRHEESPRPLIVTSGRAHDFSLAQAFVQLAALLNGAHADLTFTWVGASSAGVRALLEAGGVRVLAAPTSEARAGVLAQAWIYVVPDAAGADGVPLAQAMAVGLPCVVVDTPACRDLVIHRLGGLVCADPATWLAGIAELLDSPALRARYGQSARSRAWHWAGRQRRLDSLLVAHGLPTVDTSR